MAESELQAFRRLIDQLRPVALAAETRRANLSPLAQLWARELAGTGRSTLRSAYRAGGLRFVVDGVAHLLDEKRGPSMAPWDLIPILEEIGDLEERVSTSAKEKP